MVRTTCSVIVFIVIVNVGGAAAVAPAADATLTSAADCAPGTALASTTSRRDTRAITARSPRTTAASGDLDDAGRVEVIERVFGDDGLRPAIVKMFCDPFHEPVNDNDDPSAIDARRFDHAATTRWTRYFAAGPRRAP